MSFEINKSVGAILTAILILLLSSFIASFIYPSKDDSNNYNNGNKISYSVGEELNIAKNDIAIPEQNVADNKIKYDIKELIKSASIEEGSKFSKKNCSVCHSLDDPLKNKIGPSLLNVYDRKIGKMEGFKYSKVFLQTKDLWNEENLFNFLINPKKWLPGTKMAYGGIKNEKMRANVVAYLKMIASD